MLSRAGCGKIYDRVRGDIGVLSVIKVCRVFVFVSRRVAGDWSLEGGRSEPS